MKSINPVNQRNYGIDFLRLVAAFYIVVLHTIYQGGIYYCVAPGSAQEKICQVLLAVSYCAVNMFGIISGYVGYSDSEKGYKFKNYILLWLHVVFYGTVITCCGRSLFPAVDSNSRLLHTLFPLLHNTYWYFTAYTVLFFFMPLLNNAVRNSRKETLTIFLCFCLFLFSPFETLYGYFYCNNGYSFLWLMVLYLLGGILKKLQIGQRISSSILFFGIIAVNVLMYVLYSILPELADRGSHISPNKLMAYTFPLHLYAAVLYVMLFVRMEFGKRIQKLIALAAPGAFSVYIVNVHPFVWAWLKDRFCHWATCPVINLLGFIFTFAFLFVATTVTVDYFRRKIFGILHIERCLLKITSKNSI